MDYNTYKVYQQLIETVGDIAKGLAASSTQKDALERDIDKLVDNAQAKLSDEYFASQFSTLMSAIFTGGK